MKPIASLTAAACSNLRLLLSDIDDTLTTDGRLTAEAYTALEALRNAGMRVVPVTGRPGGWCDHIARMWPVDAVVGENGAFYFWYDAQARRLRRRFVQDEATRTRNREALERLQNRVLDAVPGAAIASDQRYRENDLAIDVCEDVQPLDRASVARIVEICRDAGANAKVSSIHVNAWFGDYDKLTTTRLMTENLFGLDIGSDNASALFIGDSPNDAPMFRAFGNSVGVANVRDFADRIDDLPTYVTQRTAGAGFAEAARLIVEKRGKQVARARV
ncbi:HAD-IIB family hydrolase [Ferruginivarius sediminum]|uniref:HAD-IIB family hydrolase n=1 Tax=Ferruginivarius sediminum TaxID=2661937 RepID=A0A369TD57_9PROT|nr:HAD-IIB family hydrolase [Ferruginivarius sediminum]RDD62464.1 HAD-IIB family hydrolase [Ferruginivarius sediminum]